MAERLNIDFPSTGIEPLKTNRWLLSVGDIKPYLIRNVKLNTVNNNGNYLMVLGFSVMNTVEHIHNPTLIFDIKKIKLEFLDPVGSVINGYDMDVVLDNGSFKCDYSINDILTHEYVFYVTNLKFIYENVVTDNPE